MKFKYTALDPNNKQSTGVLEAGSIEEAKEELHQMNLSILVINKISEEEYVQNATQEQVVKNQSGIVTYIFKAKDPYQKEIEGTIDAKDLYSAFKRLVTNYHFEVLGLHPKEQNDLDDGVLKTNFEADLKLWEKQLQAEGVNLEKELRAGQVNKDLEGENDVLNRKMVEEIDHFIIQSKGILKIHSEQFSVAFLEEIQNKLANLERIRASNNIDHITKVSNELYELLSHPDRFSSLGEEKQRAYRESLSGIQKNELIQKQYEIEQKAQKLGVIKGQFDGVLGALKKIKPDSPVVETNSVTDWRFLSKSLWLYIKAPRGPLKEARYEAFRNALNKRNAKVAEEKKRRKETLESFWANKINQDYSLFFREINSLVGWLLTFYVAYFFLADLSLEKSVGLPEVFVFKTLQSPLIVNVSLLLLWVHLLLKIKLSLFHKQFLGSFFLFAFGGVLYGMVVANF